MIGHSTNRCCIGIPPGLAQLHCNGHATGRGRLSRKSGAIPLYSCAAKILIILYAGAPETKRQGWQCARGRDHTPLYTPSAISKAFEMTSLKQFPDLGYCFERTIGSGNIKKEAPQENTRIR